MKALPDFLTATDFNAAISLGVYYNFSSQFLFYFDQSIYYITSFNFSLSLHAHNTQ